MTNTEIPNQPHVICYRASDARLRAVSALDTVTGLDARFAIYGTRREANEAIRQCLTGADTVYFSVPTSALFDVETKEVFTIKR